MSLEATDKASFRACEPASHAYGAGTTAAPLVVLGPKALRSGSGPAWHARAASLWRTPSHEADCPRSCVRPPLRCDCVTAVFRQGR